MKNLKKIGKKGFMQAITDTGIALIVIFIGLLLISLLAKHIERSQEDKGSVLLKEARAKSLAALYLKQELLVDGQTISVSDLITIIGSESDSNSAEHKKALTEFTVNFFSSASFKSEYTGVKITINDKSLIDETDYGFLKRVFSLTRYKQTSVVNFELPSKNGNTNKIVIYFEQLDNSVPEKSIQNAKASVPADTSGMSQTQIYNGGSIR